MRSKHELGASRVCDELRSVEDRMVVIRKSLTAAKHKLGARGVIDDAVKLAESIERMAQFGQRTTAAKAVEVAASIEGLLSILAEDIDSVLASRR